MLGLGVLDCFADQDPRLLEQILGPRAHDGISGEAGHQLGAQGRQRLPPGVARRAGPCRLLEQRVDLLSEAGGSASQVRDEGVEQALLPARLNSIHQTADGIPHGFENRRAAFLKRVFDRSRGRGRVRRRLRVARHRHAASLREAAAAAPHDQFGG